MHMLIALLLLAGLPQSLQPPTAEIAKENPDIVLFDGSTHPESIPEYEAWRIAFRALSHMKARDADLGLILSRADSVLVFAAAAAQNTRDKECWDAQDAVIAKAKAEGLGGRETLELLYNGVVMDCRWKVLEAEEQLLGALSVEGQIALNAWVNENRKGITVRIPRSELFWFGKPR